MHPVLVNARDAVPIWFVNGENFRSVGGKLGAAERAFIAAAAYEPKPGRLLLLPSSGQSLGGVLFGMSITTVKPPASAADVPLNQSSLCCAPGSRK